MICILTNIKKEIQQANQHHYAISQFSIDNTEWTKFILEERKKQNNPIIIGISEITIKYFSWYQTVITMILESINDFNKIIPVSIHLNNGTNFESCKKAVKTGFTSIMIDVSAQRTEKNIEETSKVIELTNNKIPGEVV